MGRKLRLAIGMQRDFAHRQPLAELQDARLADHVALAGLAQEVDVEVGGTACAIGPAEASTAAYIATSASANIDGPEIVPPGRNR